MTRSLKNRLLRLERQLIQKRSLGVLVLMERQPTPEELEQYSKIIVVRFVDPKDRGPEDPGADSPGSPP